MGMQGNAKGVGKCQENTAECRGMPGEFMGVGVK